MGDVNEDSNISSGPVFYGEKTLTNGHYYNGFIQKMVADANLGCDKEALRQRILEHEAIFKDQVYELHRLYRRQIHMLEEVRSEYPRQRISIDTSSSSSLLPSQKPYEDGQKWQIPSFPSFNSCARPYIFGADISNSPLSCPKVNNNNNSPKDCERPSKVRKWLFDLELPPDENVDHEAFEESSYKNTSSRLCFRGDSGLADLNEPVNVEESNGSLTHKMTSLQKQSSFLSSPQSNVVLGANWRMNGCYTPNGFCHGSSSGSKDPCARLRYHRNYNNLDDRPQKIFKGSNFMDLPDTTKGIDLNNDSNSSSKCDDRAEKILGFSVLGNSCISRNESSSLVSTSASLRCPRENGKIKTEMGSRGFDINIAWDDHANKQADMDPRVDKTKNHFDLNSCLTEDEDVLVPEFVKSSNEKVKIRMEIDLEAPAVPEAEEEEEAIDEVKKVDHFDDRFLAKVAAEAIVAMTGISGQHEVTLRSNDNDRLLWFAEVIEKAGYVSNEPDEYEELTLKQELTKEEDYMPKPLAPDFQEPDEAGPLAGLTRPRRGQTRRGRPRRDFQRDILPGLVSLSRHEVTDDLEIFGGLMRATGHSWNLVLTRRTGIKGRRKSVAAAVEPPPPPVVTPPPPAPPPPLSKVVGLEEGSLTGWGKTTRRHRRQRCASGTFVVVPLT